MVYGRTPFQNLSLPQKIAAITSDSVSIDFPKIESFFCFPFICSNPWLMDVLMSCLQRNPSKRPSIGGQRGLLQHPFLQPLGEQAMLQFQAVTLGTENMQDIVKQILSSQDDSIWEKENCIDAICKVVF